MKKNRKSAQSPASTAPAPYRHLQVEAIEPRILFSGAPVEPTEGETADAQAPADEATELVLAVSPEAPASADGAGVSGDSGATLVATGSGTADLNAETLAAIADAAKQRWIDAGISAEQLSALNSVTYQISDLSGNALGKANGYTITIDRDAAGSNAWFIDSTPLVDEEFGATGTALADGGAAGAYDLLSTVLHEQGHVLGLADVPGDGAAVMNGLLSQGARRSPAAGTANGAVVGSVEGDAFLGGTHLPPDPATEPAPTGGTGTFSDSGQLLGKNSTFSVALGDVDGDGDLDIVEGIPDQANRVWLNNGSGSFTDSSQAIGNHHTRNVVLGDVDGDGDLDLVEGNRHQANRVWLNDGFGSFSDSGQTLGNHSTLSVATGDVDGDGDLDLVEGNYDQANRVWLNNGFGTFSNSGQALGNHGTFSVALGDVDGDGDLDLVEGNHHQANRVWLNNGAGSFTDSGQTLGNHGTLSVALGDVDSDGDLDLIEGNFGQANRIWLNDGSGTFSDSGQTLGNHTTRSVALGDVDGDGDLDLVEGGDFQAGRVWLNDGSGSFSDSGQALGNHNTQSVVLGDVDGDGDLDLVEGNQNQPNRVWLNQNQPQTDLTLTKTSPAEQVVQGGAVTYTITVSNAGPLAVTSASVTDTFSPLLTGVSWSAVYAGGATGNANGSGDIDELVDLPVGSSITYTVNATVVDAGTANLAAQSIVTNTAQVSLPRGFADSNLANNADSDSDIVVLAATGGTGSFSDSGQPLGSGIPLSLALGDVDGDGDLDLIEGNVVGYNRVLFNDGSGTFSDSGQTLGYHDTWSVALGDVDGDGDLDIVEGTRNDGSRLWLNDGTGSFTESGQALGDHKTYSVALGDLDGDGDLDLVEGNTNDHANRIWLNDGAGTFTDSGQTLGDHDTITVVLGDIDGDGDLDFVEGNANNQSNRVWLNDGAGSFTDSGQLLGKNTTYNLALGDVDGDGDLDLVESRYDGTQIWVNNGAGSFSSSGQSLALSSFYYGGSALADVDGDGDLDLIRWSFYQSNQVWLNDGAGSFSDSGQSLGNHDTLSVAVGDLDGDGDLDFVAGNYGRTNQVWLNGVASTDTTTATVDPSGNLVIEDVAGGDTDDDLTIVIDGTDYLITDPTNGVTIRIPLASVTGDIIVNGNGGDDTLTVDLTGGLIPRNIVFNGGTGGDDALVISDTSGRTYGSYTHSADNANDGNIEIDGLTVTYTGLEPITDLLVVADRTFNFSGGIDAITVTDDGATITIDSPLAESVTFTRPTNSLTIIGDAGDSVTVTNATTLAADVSITAGTFEIAGGASLDLSAATTPAAAIIANRVLIGGALNTGAAGNITFTPLTTGNVQRYLLGSGADPVDDTVRISAAEISRLTAGLITVGDSETGTITVDADIVLPADLTLVTPGTVNFNRKINGNFDLSIVSGGTTVARPPGLGGIGALTPLDTVTTDAGGTTRVQNGGVINSTGDQTYNDLFMVGTTDESVGIATLTAPTVNFSATTDYHLDLNGDAGAGLVGGHDQLAIVGALNLGGATVTVDLGFTPTVGNSYTIITNDGADAVSGTFVQGASVAALFGGTVSYFDIDYAGGDGNDVVLTVAAG
ncbi:MAG: VCBS repeat-containing protein, partial [Verrucomicrobiales bacterium]|nr:VCBS repeat-containing protein [Verrucomicrobiales bacterium]